VIQDFRALKALKVRKGKQVVSVHMVSKAIWVFLARRV
jgi:hypothetical protein